MSGIPSTSSMSSGAPSQPRSILKTSASGAAKREAERLRCLAQSSDAIELKIVVVGGDAAGKTSLIRALTAMYSTGRGVASPSSSDRPTPSYEPTGGIEVTTVKVADFRDRSVLLTLWEVPFAALPPAHMNLAYHAAHAVLLLFDASPRRGDEVDDLNRLLPVDACRDEVESRIMRFLPPSSGVAPFPLYLVAHKSDAFAETVARLRAVEVNDAAMSDKLKRAGGGGPTHYAVMLRPELEEGDLKRSRGGPPNASSSGQVRVPSHAGVFACGLEYSDTATYAETAGYRACVWTTTSPVAASLSVQALCAMLVDDVLEYWGYTQLCDCVGRCVCVKPQPVPSPAIAALMSDASTGGGNAAAAAVTIAGDAPAATRREDMHVYF